MMGKNFFVISIRWRTLFQMDVISKIEIKSKIEITSKFEITSKVFEITSDA